MPDEEIVVPPRDPAAFRVYFSVGSGSRLGRNRNLFMIEEALSAIRQLELNTEAIMQELHQQELRDALEDVTSWRASTREPMPATTFADHERTLHRWATLEAFLSGETGGANRAYEPERIAGELEKPLDWNVGYLNGWMARQG